MRISIFGYGVTTTPLVEFLNAQGHRLTIYDDKFKQASTDEAGNTLLPSSEFNPETSDMEILSPGIPPYHPLVQKAQNLISEYDYFDMLLQNRTGSEVTMQPQRGKGTQGDSFAQSQDRSVRKHNSEVNMSAPRRALGGEAGFTPASQDLAGSKATKREEIISIWISGTNGKTTTTEMTTLLLSPFDAQSGGNIGTPLTTLYRQNPRIWVLESSSFMLHYTHTATPHIYALLPVREDHISWHGSFEGYVSDKLSPLSRMGEQSIAFIPHELSSHSLTQGFKGRLITYANSSDIAKILGVDSEQLTFKEPFLLDALLALGVARYTLEMLGENESMEESVKRLNAFKIGAHRIAESYDAFGRLWVDDSKGTNVDATIEALKRYEGRHIVAILGGDDKGANLLPLFEYMQGRDIQVVSIGSNEGRLLELCARFHIPITPKGNLAAAMAHIHATREKNAQDVVLLSPAAASLDQFKSYQERGKLFISLALEDKNSL